MCRHLFRPVNEETIARIVNRIEQEKMHMARLSASATLSAGCSQLSAGDDSREPQPMAVDEPSAVTSASDQPMEWPGVLQSLLSVSYTHLTLPTIYSV